MAESFRSGRRSQRRDGLDVDSNGAADRRATTALGHEDPFPPPSRNARSEIRKQPWHLTISDAGIDLICGPADGIFADIEMHRELAAQFECANAFPGEGGASAFQVAEQIYFIVGGREKSSKSN